MSTPGCSRRRSRRARPASASCPVDPGTGQVTDRILQLGTQEAPAPPELAAGQDATPRVLRDRVGLELEQRGDVGHGAAVDPADWLGVAESEWRNAVSTTRQAPPDYWFPSRLEFLAATAARKAEALGMLDDDVRVAQDDVRVAQDDDPLLDSESLSYELRPGSRRPGPPTLWARFDKQVAGLRDAVRDGAAGPQRTALEAVSLSLHEIAEELDRYRGSHGEWITLDGDEPSDDA